MTFPVFQSYLSLPPDIEILQLKDFISRGESPQWCVYVGDQSAHPFQDYGEASAYFERVPPRFWAELVLFTRISTSVQFRFRPAAEGGE